MTEKKGEDVVIRVEDRGRVGEINFVIL